MGAPKGRWMAILFASLLVSVLTISVWAPSTLALPGDTGTTPDGFDWEEVAGGRITITGYSGADAALAIPSTVNALPVTAIGNNSFQAKPITSVDIPGSVTSIGAEAFSGCTSLSTVTLHGGLQTIGGYAFSQTAITSIDIPSSVTSIGEAAFAHCSLSAVSLHDGLQTIGEWAFFLTPITSIDIPGSVTTISSWAFNSCWLLSRAVIWNGSATFGVSVFHTTALDSDGIYGFAGSTAQTYASTNTHPFHLIHTVTLEGTSLPDEYVLEGDQLGTPPTPSRTGYVFGGWFLDQALTQSAAFPMAVSGDMTLYAKWTALTLALSPSDGHTYTGGRIAISPSVPGGTWDFDGTLLSRDGNVFTGLKAGTARVTYTVGSESVYADVVIAASSLPGTGQDFTAPWVLLGTGLLMALMASMFLAIERSRRRAD